jgi:hypothetical protein
MALELANVHDLFVYWRFTSCELTLAKCSSFLVFIHEPQKPAFRPVVARLRALTLT